MKNFFFLLFLSRKKKSKKETNNSIALAHILTLSFSRTGDRRIVFLASFFFVFESYGNLSIHQYFFFFFYLHFRLLYRVSIRMANSTFYIHTFLFYKVELSVVFATSSGCCLLSFPSNTKYTRFFFFSFSSSSFHLL